MLTIRDIQPADEARWGELWAGYTGFYEHPVPDHITAHTWARIMDPAVPMLCRVAEKAGVMIGFSISILHHGTWVEAPICYLEDLFVDEAARGAGAGRALINDLIAVGRERGWSRLYWHTQAGNANARRLYDTFTEADDFVRYRLVL